MNDKYLAGIVPELRPFDLEAAKRGEPLVTRDGRRAKFMMYVPEADAYKIIAFIEGDSEVDTFTDKGRYRPGRPGEDTRRDLFMAPKPKRTVWVNFYAKDHMAFWYTSEELAKSRPDIEAVAVAVPVQIEVW